MFKIISVAIALAVFMPCFCLDAESLGKRVASMASIVDDMSGEIDKLIDSKESFMELYHMKTNVDGSFSTLLNCHDLLRAMEGVVGLENKRYLGRLYVYRAMFAIRNCSKTVKYIGDFKRKLGSKYQMHLADKAEAELDKTIKELEGIIVRIYTGLPKGGDRRLLFTTLKNHTCLNSSERIRKIILDDKE